MMTTLTDRYCYAVLRVIPRDQRADLEPEIRALVADAIEAHSAAGTEPATAERAALTELGDPDLLAQRYLDRSPSLIGPRSFAAWWRLLTVLVSIVVPLVTVLAMAGSAIDGEGIAQIAGSGLSAALMALVQVAFWVTLAFALLERSGTPAPGRPWTPERLPELPRAEPGSALELVVSVVALAFGAGALVWQQVARPVTIDGSSYPLLDPALWSFWLPWFLVVLGLEAGFAVALYVRGRWTWPLATLNIVLAAAFAVPAISLLQAGTLFDPGLTVVVRGSALADALAPTSSVAAVAIAAVAILDAINGIRKALEAHRSPLS
jgi:hypothetical protein